MFFQVGLIVFSLAAIAQGLQPRIIGGHDAPNHKYPYQVSFRDEPRGHFCGGSILNKRWLLSAAHCFEKGHIKGFWISVGTNFLNESGTIYQPKGIVVPKEYKTGTHNDIALIRLKKDIVFTDFVDSVRLPTEDLQDYSKTAIFAGWGRLAWMGKRRNELQEIILNLLAPEKCKKVLTQIDKRHICTLNKSGEGICSGDSGGPLIVDGVQVGIASYGKVPCGEHPEAWTRVFSYRDWLLETMQKYDSVRQ